MPIHVELAKKLSSNLFFIEDNVARNAKKIKIIKLRNKFF